MAKEKNGVKSMEERLQGLDLVDLLSERHILLRKIIEDTWNSNHDIYISNSEWFIMAKTYKKQPTIASISKNVNITRQATHKFVKSLEQKGLVEVGPVENNKKEKCLRLTELGERYHEENEKIRTELVRQIANTIGTEKVKALETILKLDWGVKPN